MYLNNRRRFRIDDTLSAAGQTVHLPLRVAAGRDGRDLLDTGNVLAAAVAQRFAQILQAHHGRTWFRTSSHHQFLRDLSQE